MADWIDHRQVHAEQMADPEFARIWQETELARAVALRLLAYRAEHNLTQTALARRLGMKQPQVARLEAGEHNPSIATLERLARVLGIEFTLHITSKGLDLTA
jgi:ribosome-binding protein aMBF1 (putative translation factor)